MATKLKSFKLSVVLEKSSIPTFIVLGRKFTKEFFAKTRVAAIKMARAQEFTVLGE